MNRILYAVLLLCAAPALLLAQVPNTMSYQGYLTDIAGTPVADGTYNLTFALYTVSSGGAAIWTETHPSVAVGKGLFNVTLGRGNPTSPLTIPFDQEYFLGIRVGADPEMTPRVRLTTSAYAFRTRTADGLAPGAAVTLGGDVTGPYATNTIAANAVTTGKIADNAVTTQKIADNAVTVAKIAPDVISSLDGVSNDGGNIDLIAGANITITPDNAANTITIAATGGGGGITLPHNQSYSSTVPILGLTQTGTGARVANFIQSAAGTTWDAVHVESNASSTGLSSLDVKAVGGKAIECYTASATAPTIYAYNSGNGPVADFGNATTSTGDIVHINKSGGTGKGLRVDYTGSGNAVYIENNSTGTGLELKQDGTGIAAYFHIDNVSSTQNALRAVSLSTSASSDALEATGTGGRALKGTSANGGSTVWSQNTGAGCAYYGTNSSTSWATVAAVNTNAAATAKIFTGNNGSSEVFYVNRAGNVWAAGNLQADYLITSTNLGGGTPSAGAIYRDNVIYAWCRVSSGGAILNSLGIAAVTKTGTGQYSVDFTATFPQISGYYQYVPIITCKGGAYFATVNSVSASSFTLITYNAAGVATDSEFYVILTGRP